MAMKKKKKSITGKVTGILAINVTAVAFLGFTYLNIKHLSDTESGKDTSMEQTAQQIEKAGIQAELVCMVNDAYMGRKQIPVPVEDKVYYGCCQMCVGKLQNNKKIRFAKDPLTGEMVDKSEAFIDIKPGSDSEVLYFKSKENFTQYSQAAL